MTDPKDFPQVDHDRPREAAFDKADAFTGEDYSIAKEREMGAELPSGAEDAVAAGADATKPATMAGRAHFDPTTGAVSETGLAEDE